MDETRSANNPGENDAAEEWEEVLMMVDIPKGIKLNPSQEKDIPLQVLGLWSEEPVIKLDNMIYAGEIKSTIGSQLFVELKEGDDKQKKTEKNGDGERTTVVTDRYMKLQPVDLVKKEGEMEGEAVS